MDAMPGNVAGFLFPVKRIRRTGNNHSELIGQCPYQYCPVIVTVVANPTDQVVLPSALRLIEWFCRGFAGCTRTDELSHCGVQAPSLRVNAYIAPPKLLSASPDNGGIAAGAHRDRDALISCVSRIVGGQPAALLSDGAPVAFTVNVPGAEVVRVDTEKGFASALSQFLSYLSVWFDGLGECLAGPGQGWLPSQGLLSPMNDVSVAVSPTAAFLDGEKGGSRPCADTLWLALIGSCISDMAQNRDSDPGKVSGCASSFDPMLAIATKVPKCTKGCAGLKALPVLAGAHTSRYSLISSGVSG